MRMAICDLWNTGQGCPVNPQAGMPALRGQRALLDEQFDAIFSQTLIDLGDVGAVARFHGAQYMHA